MDIQVTKYTIADLISRAEGSLLGEGKIFIIPRFQREYSWVEKQWQEFSEDIKRAFLQEGLETDYWGNIIVYQSDRYINIVDGQQRIVTLLLCLLALDESLVVNGRHPLRFNNNQQDIFQKLLDGTPMTPAEKRHQLVVAKDYFREFFRKFGLDRDALVRFIYSTQITVVVVDSEFESHLLFGRINTRGLELHDVDLIKYLIFSTIDKQSGPLFDDEVLKKWHQLQETTSSFNMSIEYFIELYFYTKYKKGDKRLFESFSEEVKGDDYLLFLDNQFQTQISS